MACRTANGASPRPRRSAPGTDPQEGLLPTDLTPKGRAWVVPRISWTNITDSAARTAAPQVAVSRWTDLPTADQAKKLEKIRPGAFDRIMDGWEREQRHDHRMNWAYVCLRLLCLLCHLGAVATLGWTAMQFADHGAPTHGLAIFGALTASVIGAIATVRRSRNRY